MNDSILISVHHQKMLITADEILYVEASDKVCIFHLKDNEMVSCFITLSEVEQHFEGNDFLRISRRYLVNQMAIRCIGDTVKLINLEQLSYTLRKKSQIKKQFEQYVHDKIYGSISKEDTTIKDIIERYSLFDNVPIGCALLEIVCNENGTPIDMIFRYVNDKLAEIEKLPKEVLLGSAFYHGIFRNTSVKWLEYYSEIAQNGGYQELIDYSPEIGSMIRVQCYQPEPGFCACQLTKLSEDYLNEITKLQPKLR